MNKSKLLLVVVLAVLVGGCGQMDSSPEETEKNTSGNGPGRFAAN